MKKIILLLVGVLLLSCTKESGTQYSTDSEKVFLRISDNTTKKELTKIAAEFQSEKNISVDFSKSKFSDDGTIQKLNLEVDCNDGFKGTTRSSELSLKTNEYGFSRNYAENSKTPFSIGKM